MRTLLPLAAAALALGVQVPTMAQLKINDQDYFERQGVNVLVYSNLFTGGFNDEKNSGIEIIHHGVRTVQGGAVRLATTPEQWDLVPSTPKRDVDHKAQNISVVLRYDDFDFDSRLSVTAVGNAFDIEVFLDKPLPAELVGKAGFNIEFLPSQYWNKTYVVDGKLGRFPKYAVSQTVTRPNSEKVKQYKGFRTYDDRGTDSFVDPLPMAQGHAMTFAPEDPERTIRISSDQDLMLYDGRMIAQNGWYVLRTPLPANQTGCVVKWRIEPNAAQGWVREPNIGFSQVGYVPAQPKVAVIELDKVDTVLPEAQLMKINEDGTEEVAFTGAVSTWGRYYKYNYAKFDFSAVRTPGIYYIQYGKTKTVNFLIDDSVYNQITDATSDVWIPVHMNHMAVNEGYRLWHGEPYKEGYLQAPVNSDHFDLHGQGPTTDTKYASLEHIPGLNVGGYFDAGDFDIETNHNIDVVNSLLNLWDKFQPERDETFVDEEHRYVDLHRPDGKPDVLQYIEHGLLNLLAQAENIGHMAGALSNSLLDTYHHLGDPLSITDGLRYDPSLKPYEVSADGLRSGTPDDMWAFTSRKPNLDLDAANMFAHAARTLRTLNPELAERCLAQSKRLEKEANELIAQNPKLKGRNNGFNAAASLQLYVSTQDKKYLKDFSEQIWTLLDKRLPQGISTALDAVPFMDAAYREKLRPYMLKYKDYVLSLEKDNPYGVPIGLGNWAGSSAVVSYGTTLCQAATYFPEIISPDHAYKASAYIFGCHPYHNYSLVATVGATRPKNVFYGNNRADFSAIPGNVAPGLLFRHPDHFENYDDWPFFWGQNEGIINGNCAYLHFGTLLKNISK